MSLLIAPVELRRERSCAGSQDADATPERVADLSEKNEVPDGIAKAHSHAPRLIRYCDIKEHFCDASLRLEALHHPVVYPRVDSGHARHDCWAQRCEVSSIPDQLAGVALQ